MIKLSNTAKLGARSWSLNALETCAGSIDKNGELVEACKSCYATRGNYRFKNVKEPRDHNRKDWKRSEWVDEFVALLASDKEFRWFDSGDVYSARLAEKIFEVMKLTPHVKHWIPSRMHKFEKYAPIFEKMKRLKNVSVRFSSDSISGEYSAKHGSTIVPDLVGPVKRSRAELLEKWRERNPSVSFCKAIDNQGKCGTCRDCWNPKIKVIAYFGHGRDMKKAQKRKMRNGN